MPLQAPVLFAQMLNNVNSNMAAVDGVGPLGRPGNPQYFIALCQAISTGIAKGTPTILFTTSDTGQEGAPPIPGAGVGVGIKFDADYFSQQMYTKCRDKIMSQFGATKNAPWIPDSKDNGLYLKAITDGIGKAIKDHFALFWILTSVNPLIYSGTAEVEMGNFHGVVAPLVQSLILASSPLLSSGFWPTMCQIISEAYADTVMNKSTATLTIVGFCVPSLSQVCGVPGTGSGTGAAT